MFVLNSDITIGKFRFSGVHEVTISRSMHGIAETASIKMPSVATIVNPDGIIKSHVVTGNQFKEGDAVTIKLGYNGQLQTEFAGFVSLCDLNMPLEVKCEGYSWLLRKNSVPDFYKKITVKELLEKAVTIEDKRYAIKVECAIDLTLKNVAMENKSGFDIINDLHKYTDGCLTCFFVRPDTLWCGLVYSGCAAGKDVFGTGSVQYRPGYNVLKENSLKIRDAATAPAEMKYVVRKPDGNVLTATSDVFSGAEQKQSRILNNVDSSAMLLALANEKVQSASYNGYEGSVNTFLQPYVATGYAAYVKDSRYPERDGQYLVEGVQTKFGVNGARRMIEIGPRITPQSK